MYFLSQFSLSLSLSLFHGRYWITVLNRTEIVSTNFFNLISIWLLFQNEWNSRQASGQHPVWLHVRPRDQGRHHRPPADQRRQRAESRLEALLPNILRGEFKLFIANSCYSGWLPNGITNNVIVLGSFRKSRFIKLASFNRKNSSDNGIVIQILVYFLICNVYIKFICLLVSIG
jgi:hypothetical protein